MYRTADRAVDVDGLSVFYRDAGPQDAPAILLLHGFPSSSRMWQPLLDRLADRFRLVAPDYPGFGHSDAPSHTEFAYTFDRLAEVVGHFTEALGLTTYTLVMQDYGGPVGFRLAIAHPENYDPDLWTDELAFLSGPGQQDIQADLFYDYRTNVHVLGAGHFALDEQPDLIADLTRRFLQRRDQV